MVAGGMSFTYAHYLEQASEGDDDTWRVYRSNSDVNHPIAVCWSEDEARTVMNALNASEAGQE